MGSLVRLREVSWRGTGAAFFWTWGTEKKEALDNSSGKPLPPIQVMKPPTGTWTVSGDPGSHVSMRPGSCVHKGEHQAIRFVNEWTSPEAAFAHGREARCRFCGVSIPIEVRSLGRLQQQVAQYTTHDGVLYPGCYFWLVREGVPTAPNAMKFLDKVWSNHSRHLIVVTPRGDKWDTCAPLDKDEDGRFIMGELPTISVSSVIVESWKGRIEEGLMISE